MSLAIATALLSAFLDNLTTMLLMVPITFLLADALDIDPIPLVLIEIIASNIGGTSTLIGDPPNILIAGRTDLRFVEFLVNLAPVAIVAFVVVTPGCTSSSARGCRSRPKPGNASWSSTPAARSRTRTSCGPAARPRADDRGLLLHQMLHIEPATVALAGATLMLLISRQSVEDRWPVSSGRRCSSSSGSS